MPHEVQHVVDEALTRRSDGRVESGKVTAICALALAVAEAGKLIADGLHDLTTAVNRHV